MSKIIKKKRNLLSILLCFIILLSTLPQSVFAAENARSDSDFKVSSQGGLVSAFSEIYKTDSGEFTISLTDDIVLSGRSSEEELTVPENKTVTLLGNGHTITYGNDTQNADGSLTLGTSGGTLNLGNKEGADNLTIKTNNTKNHPDPLISIYGNGTVNMYNGVLLTNNIDTSSDAGGVDIQNGTFNMYGGTISDCQSYFATGGGVRVYGTKGKAIFNMYGGVIENNNAEKFVFSNYSDGGGVLVMGENSEFTMYDGIIRGNKASYRGGGICNYMSTVTIKGGTITDNISGSGENGNKGYGGGICNYYGTTIIEGGTVENNQALNGGGICAYGINYKDYVGKMDITNCLIQNNKAKEAGGIFTVYSNDVNIKNCKINSNISEDCGGGVYAYSSETEINNSEIDNNQAVIGGGIMTENSQVAVQDGTAVRNNTVSGENSKAGGIYFDNDGLSMSGKVTVQNNKLISENKETENNVYFMYSDNENSTVYQTVKISGALNGSQIGVTEQGVFEGKEPSPAFTDGYDSYNQGIHPNQYFTSDDTSYAVLYSKDNNKEARLGKVVNVNYEWVGTAPEDAVLPTPDTIELGTAYIAKEKPESTEKYSFSGWYIDKECKTLYEDGTILNNNTTLYGKWDLNTTPIVPTVAAYSVEHYKENPDGTYTLVEKEFPLYDKIGSTVTAAPKLYEHYHINNENSVITGTVTEPTTENGTVKILVLKIFYDLDEVNVSYDLNGGTATNNNNYDTETVKYGSSVTLKEKPIKENNIFIGWSDGKTIYQPGDEITVFNDTVLTAQWKEDNTVVNPPADDENPNTSDKDNNEYIPDAPSGKIPKTGNDIAPITAVLLFTATVSCVVITVLKLKKKSKNQNI